MTVSLMSLMFLARGQDNYWRSGIPSPYQLDTVRGSHLMYTPRGQDIGSQLS